MGISSVGEQRPIIEEMVRRLTDDRAWQRSVAALDVSGFNAVRSYIFGDTIAASSGLPKAGVPDFAGYAIGYRVVQRYLQRTGRSVVEATFLPSQEIIAESGFFA